jgi:hypothetical protein
MNKKYFFGIVAILLVAGVAWIGRSVYRARNNLVTIDVYNTPLASVIKQLERQTGETILIGKGVEAKVTLAVKNLPLDEALDRLGRQIGANWSKWHAVYGSDRALSQLETALRDRKKIEEAGWTNIAPQDFLGGLGLPPIGQDDVGKVGGGGAAVVGNGKPIRIQLEDDDIKGGDVEAAIREKLKAAGADESVIANAAREMRQQSVDVDVQASGNGSNVVLRTGSPQNRIRMVTRSRGPDGQVIEDVWCPERVVLEQRLQSRLGDQTYQDASEAVAREISEKVKGDVTTLYVLRQSPGGLPIGDRLVRRSHGGTGSGTNAFNGEPPPVPDIESAIKRAEAENYTRLTPEQRVQRVREKQASKTNP